MIYDYNLSNLDKAILEKLQSFIPEKIFDAHVHLCHPRHMPDSLNVFTDYGVTTAKTFKEDQKTLYGNRKVRGLILPMPSARFREEAGLRDDCNEWIKEQLQQLPDCVGTMFVMPGDTKEQIEAMLTTPQIKGFKCYHQSANVDFPTFLCDIQDYLPESAWEVANERHMTITLHMVKELSLADPENLSYIKTMTAKYPNAVLILAHCARGFSSWTTIETVRQLKGIPNIYYDLAAICEPATMFEVIRQAGVKKVMWGSDYVIDRIKAIPVSCGNTFTWLYQKDMPDGVDLPIGSTCTESLFAFYQTCLMLDATRQDVEDIFYNNAIKLYGLEP